MNFSKSNSMFSRKTELDFRCKIAIASCFYGDGVLCYYLLFLL